MAFQFGDRVAAADIRLQSEEVDSQGRTIRRFAAGRLKITATSRAPSEAALTQGAETLQKIVCQTPPAPAPKHNEVVA